MQVSIETNHITSGIKAKDEKAIFGIKVRNLRAEKIDNVIVTMLLPEELEMEKGYVGAYAEDRSIYDRRIYGRV